MKSIGHGLGRREKAKRENLQDWIRSKMVDASFTQVGTRQLPDNDYHDGNNIEGICGLPLVCCLCFEGSGKRKLDIPKVCYHRFEKTTDTLN